MKLKKVLKQMLLIGLSIIMVSSLVACGKENKEYVTNLETTAQEIISERTKFVESFGRFYDSYDEKAREDTIASITALEAGYSKFKDIKAPKDYEEIQKILAESSDMAISAMKIYKDAISEVTEETNDQSHIDQISKGDELMEKSSKKMVDALEKAKEKDSK